MVNITDRGFALPSIMIASIVMLAVLVSALAVVATSRSALNDQYYNQLAAETAESGVAMAEACIAAGNTSWVNPLRPGSGCNGAAEQGDSTGDYLVSSSSMRSTFRIAAPAEDASGKMYAVGTVELLRPSNGAVWKTYAQDVTVTKQGNRIAWRQLALGTLSTCAIGNDNKVYCWGENSRGQLGDGTTTNRSEPVKVTEAAGGLAGKSVVQLSVRERLACARTDTNEVYCWGANSHGGLGNTSVPVGGSSALPVKVAGLPSGVAIKKVATGYHHACALTTAGQVYCWGWNYDGQLGDGAGGNGTGSDETVGRRNQAQLVRTTSPSSLNGKVVDDITSGARFTCALATDRTIHCWGQGVQGQLGNGSMNSATMPVAVSMGGRTAIKVVAGSYHTCMLENNTNRTPYCWGGNGYNGVVVGTGNSAWPTTPAPVVLAAGVLQGQQIVDIDAGYYQTCVTTSTGRLYCWGWNNYGQIGNGIANTATGTEANPPGSRVPVATSVIPSGLTVRSLTTGSQGWNHTCVILSNYTIRCWGRGEQGQLGNGSTADSTAGVTVAPVYSLTSPLRYVY